MPPRTLPKKMSELGRIRIGDREDNKSGQGTHPRKLEYFRFTSSNSPLLHTAANIYGGEVTPWDGEGAPPGQFELYSSVNALDVLIPTSSAISVHYEQWRAGGCTLRCTGVYISHSPLREDMIGAPCQCPQDEHERESQARQGKACARILRLSVILPDLPGMGLWRLETKGFYATAELLGSLEMLQMSQHQLVEAVLRLEWRTVKRFQQGKSTSLQFAVPVLWPKFTPRQLLASVDQARLLMAPPQEDARALPPGAQAAEDLYGDGRSTHMQRAIPDFSSQDGVTTEKITPQGQATPTPEKSPTGHSAAKNQQADESLRRYRALYQEYKHLPPTILQSIPQQLWGFGWQDLGASTERLIAIMPDYPLVAELLSLGQVCSGSAGGDWGQESEVAREQFADNYTRAKAELRTVAQSLSSMHPDRDAWLALCESPWARLGEVYVILDHLNGPKPEPLLPLSGAQTVTELVPMIDWRHTLLEMLRQNTVTDIDLIERMFQAVDNENTHDSEGQRVLADAHAWVQAHTE